MRSREVAIEWLKRAPFGPWGDEPVAVELRHVQDVGDFAASDPTVIGGQAARIGVRQRS